MSNRLNTLVLSVTLILVPTCVVAQAANGQTAQNEAPNPKTWSEADTLRIAREVQHRLLSLSSYAVFDSLHFGIRDRTVILQGYASRPILKSDAQNAVKSIPGVESVENKISVLPLSSMDDRIRVGVYRRVYSQPALRKYTSSPVGFGRFRSVARMAGGITEDPPLGYNAIHIIVENGHVTLTGVVNNESDATIANMQANLTPGVFSVDNDLRIQGSQGSKKTAAR